MPLPVQLKAVVDEMEFGTDEWRAYINRKTGELVSFPGDVLSAVEDEDSDTAPDWELEARQACRRVLGDKDFIQLPTKRDIHEYGIIERFCQSRHDERLLDAIRGRGAFRRFDDLIRQKGIEEDWYRYRGDALRKIAADFLQAEGIPYVDDARDPTPPPEAH